MPAEKAQREFEERGFTAAVGAKHAEPFALASIEGDVLEGWAVSVTTRAAIGERNATV